MQKTTFAILPLLLFLLLSGKLGAQSIDPTLAAMIVLYTEKAESTLKSQEEAMLLESTGHVWIKEEVDGTWQIQKEFNDYLDMFHGIVVYAAQIYGFYHEIEKMVGNLGKLNDQIAKSPGNAVAVALSANRNKVYRQVILQSVEIVNDIRMVCLSDIKMTEKERTEVFFGVRPKLKEMNKTLQRLIKAVKYTSLTDVWNEITERQPSKADVPDISDKAFQRWRTIGKTVRPYTDEKDMSWASLLKAGGKAAKWLGKGAVGTLEATGKAALHPARTIKVAGTAVKTAAVGAGVGYVGWKKLTTDESVIGIVSDAIIGEKGTRKVSDTVHGAVDGIRDLKESVSGMSERVSSAAENVDGKLNGISSFLSDVSSGNGGEMLGGFLGNLTHGNVSGLGVMGLVLSAFLVFGRFGWMAKLAGAMLAMMTIGNNSTRVLSPAIAQADAAGKTRQAEVEMRSEEVQEAEQIHRRR